ncbi:hypothetical protein KOW79_007679 [Hemibagrus wyckioides]|uniref:Chemokine interleukin-8-like domain-containing protein n=1 Tax=Hemibagrus wyckioides TaxID=337641 RepID=A0A9D3NYD3_9TELE|nr:regakine-1-like [Hemibagrus wyckioides]KAG7329505.1 hypothetical protein KOW79_007679 [Hemibagrus wyckioides]
MKMSRVFLVLGFVLIMALYSDAQPRAPNPEDCCFNFFNHKIPSKEILNVKKTGPHCPHQGLIVTTRKFPGLCVHEISINGQGQAS